MWLGAKTKPVTEEPLMIISDSSLASPAAPRNRAQMSNPTVVAGFRGTSHDIMRVTLHRGRNL